MTFIAPEKLKKSFTCPHCGAYSRQDWRGGDLKLSSNWPLERAQLLTSQCDHCNKFSLWLDGSMLYPTTGHSPPPSCDLPASVRQVYEEAASIFTSSPRGAAALLRLGVQLFCIELGCPGKHINEDIKLLVKRGLPELVQQSLDIVRVTGNNAAHPGQISTDDPEVVIKLFGLINIVCEYMVTLPNRVNGIYSGLPPGSLDAIRDRDS